MAIIKGGGNIGGSSGIKWNIKAISSLENLPSTGIPGEVYIETNINVKKIKKVATIFDGDDLVDNAINIFINENSTQKRINDYYGWKFDAKFESQTILLNGEGLYTKCAFWDLNVNNWSLIEVSYNFKDVINKKSFITCETNDYYNMIIPNTFSEIYDYSQPPYQILNDFEDVFDSSSFVEETTYNLLPSIIPSIEEECKINENLI